MLRKLSASCALAVLASACVTADEPVTSTASPLTTTDVDVAPECAGLLTYVNTASFATLDAFLPSNVAHEIHDTALFNPYDSIAELLTVNGLGASRLQAILDRARLAGLVGASCNGIYDNLAVSQDDAAATVAYLNTVSVAELTGVLSFLPFPTSTLNNLLAARPFAAVGAISSTSGVGAATFRALRNAATMRGPFEDLVAVVDSINHPDAQVRLQTHFDWPSLLDNERITSITCFGIPPAQLPPGTTIRPNLADGAELTSLISSTVTLADRLHEVSARIDPSIGLADLAARTSGHTFFGCFIRSSPNPYVFDVFDFFVDTSGPFSVLSTIHAVE